MIHAVLQSDLFLSDRPWIIFNWLSSFSNETSEYLRSRIDSTTEIMSKLHYLLRTQTTSLEAQVNIVDNVVDERSTAAKMQQTLRFT